MKKKERNAGVSQLLHIHWCVHNLKEFRVQKVKDQCRDKHLNIARPVVQSVSVSTTCTRDTFHFPWTRKFSFFSL